MSEWQVYLTEQLRMTFTLFAIALLSALPIVVLYNTTDFMAAYTVSPIFELLIIPFQV